MRKQTFAAYSLQGFDVDIDLVIRFNNQVTFVPLSLQGSTKAARVSSLLAVGMKVYDHVHNYCFSLT